MHATDLSENHYNLCQKAVEIANCHGATLFLLHVIEIPTSLQWAQSLGFAELATPSKANAQTVIDTLGDALGIPNDNLFVEIGSAYSHILTKINELACDLVILGNHSIESFADMMGSTASAIMHHATCNILTLQTSK